MAKFGVSLVNWAKDNLLLVLTLTGVLVGVVLGFSLKPLQPSSDVQTLLAYPGELFVRALQLMILPCVILSLFLGAASLDARANSKIVLITFAYFIVTSLYNAVVGVILAVIIHPGDPSMKGRNNDGITATINTSQNTLMDNFLDLGRNLIPNNVFTAFFQQTSTLVKTVDGRAVRSLVTRSGSNTLGIIAITIVFGAVLSTVEGNKKIILDGAKVLETCVMKVITGIIWLTPLGVASIVCAKIIEVEDMGSLLSQLGLFIITVAIGLALYQFIVMQLIYWVILRKNPFKFYLGVLPAALTGFSADSSAAAMPVTLKCLDENVRVDPKISHFVVPIGVTVNMDGTALFLCVASTFLAQMNSISLGFGDYLTICITSTAVSIAVATAPSASLTMIFIILNSIGVPVDDVGLLFAIDWLVDRLRTTNNVLGDCYAAAIVEHYTQSSVRDAEERRGKSDGKAEDHELGSLEKI